MRTRMQKCLGLGVVAYLASILWVVGCADDPGTDTAQSGSGAAESKTDDSDVSSEKSARADDVADQTPPEAQEPLLDGWEKPAVAILLSGEQNGYFEPCGCTEIQSGGFSRRDNLLSKMKERGWTVAGLDMGGIVRRSRRQSQIKFETMLAALQQMQYQAIGLGPSELRLGPDYLLSQHQFDPSSPESGVAFVSANVVLFGSADIGTPVAYRVIEIGDLKIGVTAILGTEQAETLKAEGRLENIDVSAPEAALKPVVDALAGEDLDLRVLMSFSSKDESRQLAKTYAAFDLILTAGGAEDPKGEPEPVGKAWMVDVGHKGKSVGVLGYYPDREPRFRFELVNLDKFRFDDSLRMVEHMRFYQDRLKEERLVATEIPIRYPSTTGAKFVGAESCGDCHSQAYDKWLETPHSHAYDSLMHARAGQTEYGIPRIYDPECLACHVTGWEPQKVLRFEGGFVNPEFVNDDESKARMKRLQGQQCESCHGPGSRHIDLINDGEMEKAMAEVRVTKKQAENRVCYSCHDNDNSPNFEFESYWEQVAHPWRD